MNELLNNIVWNSMNGAQKQFTVGTERVRRFSQGFSPIIGFSGPEQDDISTLEPYCNPGEVFYTDLWQQPAPKHWQIEMEESMFKMLWQGAMQIDEPAIQAERLQSQHVDQALELTEITHPGPFAERTIELGNFYGVFNEQQLIAMAGERFQAGKLQEISSLCTHPDFRGRGLAKQLTLKLISQQLRRGKTPFLHVISNNQPAFELYRKLGFKPVLETTVRVVSYLG